MRQRMKLGRCEQRVMFDLLNSLDQTINRTLEQEAQTPAKNLVNEINYLQMFFLYEFTSFGPGAG